MVRDFNFHTDSDQFENFPTMSQEDFETLVSLLSPNRLGTHFREPIPVKVRSPRRPVAATCRQYLFLQKSYYLVSKTRQVAAADDNTTREAVDSDTSRRHHVEISLFAV
ncbi:unnamed protein product [Macrosiphum euphorbiae]|uniref:Uncharacterized protein n=1 Tax=Macrosiphum euphorbiae TaxID=13131 RepID=A0AAV0WSW2_9HEMI|nr:unnamed protein product [Macrosiphum euphorbiae]